MRRLAVCAGAQVDSQVHTAFSRSAAPKESASTFGETGRTTSPGDKRLLGGFLATGPLFFLCENTQVEFLWMQ